jgi:acetoin utilization deacetylase AcuC-like enzyme
VSERGEYDTIVNAPLRAGDGGDKFREAFETVILPRLREFKPDILIISAGFDAHTRDPLANLNLVEADFTWVTQRLMQIADETAQGRVVSVLEGGYDLQGLARSAAAHVTALMRG